MNQFPSSAIETVSGQIVDLLDPKPENFLITDIAWAISREPRFSGHTTHELPYSVGQHSIEVTNLCLKVFTYKDTKFRAHAEAFVNDQRFNTWVSSTIRSADSKWVCLLALLHDASEAYLRDLASPVKNLPGLKEAYLLVETRVMDQILIRFGLADHDNLDMAWKLVHWADVYARTVEAHHLMPGQGKHWPAAAKLENVDMSTYREPQSHMSVYNSFLEAFKQLSSCNRSSKLLAPHRPRPRT